MTAMVVLEQYFDLYLLNSFHFRRERLLSAWLALEVLYAEGKLKAIGLSNVEVPQVAWLLDRVSVAPHVIQNKLSPFIAGHELADQPDMFAFGRSHQIVVEGYSSADTHLLPNEKDPHIANIARQVRAMILSGMR